MYLDRVLRELYSGVRGDVQPDRIDLDEEALFDLLADSRRRFVVRRLAHDGVETRGALAADIAADETHMVREQVPRRRVVAVESDLRDEQLPRLDDAGVIRLDEAGEEIRPGHSVGAIASLLREVDRRVARSPRPEESLFPPGSASVDWGHHRSRSDGGRHNP